MGKILIKYKTKNTLENFNYYNFPIFLIFTKFYEILSFLFFINFFEVYKGDIYIYISFVTLSLKQVLGFVYYKWKQFTFEEIYPLMSSSSSNWISHDLLGFWILIIQTEKCYLLLCFFLFLWSVLNLIFLWTIRYFEFYKFWEN